MTETQVKYQPQTEPPLSDWLKFLREEVRFEYNISAQRVAWFLTSQTFLISAFVLGYFNSNAIIAKDFFGQIIPMIGIISSLLLRVSIMVTHIRIWQHSRNLQRFHQEGLYDGLDDFLRNIAMLYPRIVPCLLLSTWIVILLTFGYPSPLKDLSPSLLFLAFFLISVVADIFLNKFERNDKYTQIIICILLIGIYGLIYIDDSYTTHYYFACRFYARHGR